MIDVIVTVAELNDEPYSADPARFATTRVYRYEFQTAEGVQEVLDKARRTAIHSARLIDE